MLPAGTSAALRIAGVDVAPEAGAVVRGAMVYFDPEGIARRLDEADDGPGFATPDAGVFPVTPPVAVWTPGQPPVVQDDVARTLPAGADVVLRMHYKKTWITEGRDFTDRTAVGLYAADGEAVGIESLVAGSPATLDGQEVSFSYVVDDDVRLLALFPEVDIEAADVRVTATTPDGAEIPMLFLREPNTAWPTRYWFDSAIEVPRGTELTVAALLPPAAEHTPTGVPARHRERPADSAAGRLRARGGTGERRLRAGRGFAARRHDEAADLRRGRRLGRRSFMRPAALRSSAFSNAPPAAPRTVSWPSATNLQSSTGQRRRFPISTDIPPSRSRSRLGCGRSGSSR